MAKTCNELDEEVCNHLEFSIKHGGFAIGEHAQGGCSCSVCSYIRGYLIMKYYDENGYMPVMPTKEKKL